MNKDHAGIGSTVTVNYSIELEDGRTIGGRNPKSMTFTIGGGEIFPALEEAIIGMGVSEMRTVSISPEQGYGDYRENLVLQVERDVFPDDMVLVPGRTLQYQNRDGLRTTFVVQEVSGGRVTLDGNHPLAGQELIYRVEVLEID